MKKKRNVIVLLILFLSIGVTIAYLQSTDIFENIFNAGTYSVITHEEFTSPDNWKPGDTTPKTITTTNEGTIPVMVRVKLEEEWNDSSNNNLDLVFPSDGPDSVYDWDLDYSIERVSIINFDNIEDWVYKDGYYYYVNELSPGDSTSSLIESVTFNPNYEGVVICTFNSTTNSNECSSSDGYMGGTYKLSITTETVQSDAYESLWENVPIMYDYVGDNPCTYEGELVPGAEYVNGQYTYRYRKEYDGISIPFDGNHDIWLDLNDNGWGVKLTDMNSTDPVTSTLCSSINNKPIVSMSRMFNNSKSTSIDLSNFGTSNVTDMRGMFSDSQTPSLNLSSFDTSNVTDMSYMFDGSEVTILDLSNFDTSNVIDMTEMFNGVNISTLDLRSFSFNNNMILERTFDVKDTITTLNIIVSSDSDAEIVHESTDRQCIPINIYVNDTIKYTIPASAC